MDVSGRGGTNGQEQDSETGGGDEPVLFNVGRAVSLAGLLERIEAQFNAETDPEILRMADAHKRRVMIRDVVDYVLAVESIRLDRADRLAVIDHLVNDLFSYGPLAPYLMDETVSGVQISGYNRIHIRRGAGPLEPIPAAFSDAGQLERFIGRKFAEAGYTFDREQPFVEVGVRFGERPARITLTGGSISTSVHIDLRLHPAAPHSLDMLSGMGMLDADAAALLRGILGAGHGLMLAGDVGTGKTTLLQALLPWLNGAVVVVERAAEMRLPEGFRRLSAAPPGPTAAGVEFGDQIAAGAAEAPRWLALDEVRFDESEGMWAALSTPPGTAFLWAFRASVDALRLRTAFGMAVRRAQQTIDQEVIHRLLRERLPFVALMGRRDHRPILYKLSRWQAEEDKLELRQLWPQREEAARLP